jgi:hypothetical protein
MGFKIAPSIRCRKDSIVRFLKDMCKRLNIIRVTVEEVAFNHVKKAYGKFFSLVEIGKKYLREQIEQMDLQYDSTFGYITKQNRLSLGLSKKHSSDACAIVGSNVIVCPEYLIKPRRTKIWENNPTKTCVEKNGFRHFDLIKAKHRTRGFVVGSVRSLKKQVMTLRTKWDDNFPVSYKKSRLLQRYNGLVYGF